MEAVKQHSALEVCFQRAAARQESQRRPSSSTGAGVCFQGAAARQGSQWRPSSSTARLTACLAGVVRRA
eukprot:12279679-Heterocapsa_arctica.AAC.2